jgi:hypothetical protein
MRKLKTFSHPQLRVLDKVCPFELLQTNKNLNCNLKSVMCRFQLKPEFCMMYWHYMICKKLSNWKWWRIFWTVKSFESYYYWSKNENFWIANNVNLSNIKKNKATIIKQEGAIESENDDWVGKKWEYCWISLR